MLRVENRIKECDDGKHRWRGVDRISGITVHHFGVPGIEDVVGISEFYKANPQWTGGQMPYTIAVLEDGRIQQALRLSEIGPHALRWSAPTLSVVFLGNFETEPPNKDQWFRGTRLAAELCAAFGFHPLRTDENGIFLLEGHTIRPNATKSTGKNCPGAAFNMSLFRDDTESMMREDAIQRLVLDGVEP